MKKRIALGIATGVAAVFIAAATSEADPNLGTIPPHRHWVQNGNGDLVEVGPRVCGNPQLQKAFNQFHNNIHIVSPTGIHPAAPGLHNSKGADFVQISAC